jgi:N-methylhydantoinase A/oxoprolinase/acetone carboxylase beta subunit
MIREIRDLRGDFLIFHGDYGLSPPEEVIYNPLVLAHSSPAAAALGAFFLTGVHDALVIDIGGTTTDLIPIRGVAPSLAPLFIHGEKSLVSAVVAESLPLGGDCRLGDLGVMPLRYFDLLP